MKYTKATPKNACRQFILLLARANDNYSAEIGCKRARGHTGAHWSPCIGIDGQAAEITWTGQAKTQEELDKEEEEARESSDMQFARLFPKL